VESLIFVSSNQRCILSTAYQGSSLFLECIQVSFIPFFPFISVPADKSSRYLALTYLDVSAASAGIPVNYSFYLIAIANASSGVGRFTGGWFADRTGLTI
jgi:hypothetical protein